MSYSTDMSVLIRTRKRLPPAERREQILKVAAEAFARKGYRTTSVTDIVEGAHIGRGTFYLYFDSKKDIFVELLESYFQGFEGLLRENQARLSDVTLSYLEIVRTWRENLLRILEYHHDNPILTTMVYGEVFARDMDFSQRVDELFDLSMSHFIKELRLLQRSGLMRPCDPEVASTQILGSITYILMVYLAKKKKVDLDALANEILKYHLRALISPEVKVDVLEMLEQSVSGTGPPAGSH